MYTRHPIKTHTTLTGLRVITMLRPGIAGYQLEHGVLSTVKKPSYRLDSDGYSETSYSYYPTLFGLNVEDFDRIKPDQVYYMLGDGSYLMATAAVCLIAGRTEHRATSEGKPCFDHLVSDLVIAEMPEVVPIPIYHF